MFQHWRRLLTSWVGVWSVKFPCLQSVSRLHVNNSQSIIRKFVDKVIRAYIVVAKSFSKENLRAVFYYRIRRSIFYWIYYCFIGYFTFFDIAMFCGVVKNNIEKLLNCVVFWRLTSNLCYVIRIFTYYDSHYVHYIADFLPVVTWARSLLQYFELYLLHVKWFLNCNKSTSFNLAANQ